MNLSDNTFFETWRLKAIASSVSAELQIQFGKQEFYSHDEVVKACDSRNVIGDSRACALAMFANSEEAQDSLKEYNISDPVAEMRRIMASKLFFSDATSSECGPNNFSFHDIDMSPSFGGSHSGSSTEGGGFDGGSGGDS